MEMKKNIRLLAIPVTIGMGLMLTACSYTYNGGDDGPTTQPDFNPIHSSDFIYYSSTTLIGSTMGSRANDASGNIWYQTWQRPVNVTDEERTKVAEEFGKVREGAKNSVSVTWKNIWVQQVYKGQATYKDGFDSNIGLGSDDMDMLSGHLKNAFSKVPSVDLWGFTFEPSDADRLVTRMGGV